MTEFFRRCADDDRHSEDRHRVLRVDLVRRHTCQSTMSGQRQTADGRIPLLWPQEGSRFTIQASAPLLANAACY